MNSIISENDRASSESRLWNRDFTMVVIGQIISLFGNYILRFALPLYLLKLTGSAALFGTVSAISFIPMIILSPIGGIAADRVNKRDIMVILDFSTALLSVICLILIGRMNAVAVILITMILLYGIQGSYQPSVYASIPILESKDNIMQANAVINIVSSLASLAGPVAGGMIFSFSGIIPILQTAACCFALSAVMEIFIHIPFKHQSCTDSVFRIAYDDMRQSFDFVVKDKPAVLKTCIVFALINLILSSCIMIGMPVIVNNRLGFESSFASRMYGYIGAAEGIGSIIGGLSAGKFGNRAKCDILPKLLFFCGLTLAPIAIVLAAPVTPMTAYWVMFVSIMIMMVLATFASIQINAYLQMITPDDIIGKVISFVSCICMCATPIGQAIYGAAFQYSKNTSVIFVAALVLTTALAIFSNSVFREVGEIIEDKT